MASRKLRPQRASCGSVPKVQDATEMVTTRKPTVVKRVDTVASPFHFLSLPAEIRVLIYRHFFSQRGLVITSHAALNCTFAHAYLEICVTDPHQRDGATIALLQVCKQVLLEAQPILTQYVPSHLILSRDLHRLPSDWEQQELDRAKYGVPTAYITRLTLDVQTLGKNHRSIARVCGKLPSKRKLPGFKSARTSRQSKLRSLPNLDRISQLSRMVHTTLPSLRELHIRNVLEIDQNRTSQSCQCPQAGTKLCFCGQCYCTCVKHPNLPSFGPVASIGVESELRQALLSRYRAALPIQEPYHQLNRSDYFTIRHLLERGSHLYLHDVFELKDPTPRQSRRHKRTWHATYHLAPPEDSIVAIAEPPAEIIESPRQRSLRRKGEPPSPDPMDEFHLDFSALENADVLENFDFDSFLNTTADMFDIPFETAATATTRSSRDEPELKPLLLFEAELRLSYVDVITSNDL